MRVGIQVVSLGADEGVIFAQRADEAFKPASNQKLITSAAALTLLPEGFAYRTVLARRGDDLVIVGAGDPSIGDPRLARAAERSTTAVFQDWAARLQERVSRRFVATCSLMTRFSTTSACREAGSSSTTSTSGTLHRWGVELQR